jgi:hypothetical protein
MEEGTISVARFAPTDSRVVAYHPKDPKVASWIDRGDLYLRYQAAIWPSQVTPHQAANGVQTIDLKYCSTSLHPFAILCKAY